MSQDIDRDTGQTSHGILVKAVDQVSVFSSHLSAALLSKGIFLQFSDMSSCQEQVGVGQLALVIIKVVDIRVKPSDF